MTEPSSTGPLTHGFLFADLRGYTSYLERHGDAAGADLLDRYRVLVRSVVARSAGAEIKTEGDSFYLVFRSASSAVTAGLAITAAAAEATAADPGHPITVGVGIHAGEAEERPDGYVGTAVNLAARVCAVSQPGEVLVTDMVRGLTRTSGRYRFTPRGRPTLKGIAEPVALFRVEQGDGISTSTPPPGRTRVRATAAGGVVLAALVVVAAAIVVARGAPAAPAGAASEPATSGGTGVASSPIESAPIAFRGGPNTSGKHCSTQFIPRLCLTLPSGWSEFVELSNEILLSDQPNDSIGLGANSAELGNSWESITISQPSSFVVPCSKAKLATGAPGAGDRLDPGTTAIGPTWQAFVDQLRANPALTVSEAVPEPLGSTATVAMYVSLAKACDGTGKQIVYLDWWGTTFFYPLNSYFYHGFAAVPDALSRLFVLTRGGNPIVIAVTAPPERFDEFMKSAKSLLSSLELGP